MIQDNISFFIMPEMKFQNYVVINFFDTASTLVDCGNCLSHTPC